MTSIPEYYAGRSVFITGATGFMGKVLVEKLLRSCPALQRVYVLVRPKQSETAQQRVDSMLDCKLYDSLRQQQPDFARKIVAVSGDILQPQLGLSAADRDELCRSVSVVFHSAATVKFDEPLKLSIQMNVLGTRKMIQLAHQMQKLEAFVHVSTAYANCDRSEIDEVIYDAPIHPKKIIDALEWMDDDMVSLITERVVRPRPNTYTFTKALAEHLLVEEGADLPVAVVRPSIVGASWREPVPGWVDNFNGPTGLFAAIGKGLLRSMKGEGRLTADLIPVDVAINLNIAAGWYAALQQPTRPHVFNCTTGQINGVTWGFLEKETRQCFIKNPLEDPIRVPYASFTKNEFWLYLKIMFDHNLPAWLLDQWLRVAGRKPFMMRLQAKLWKGVRTLDYFTSHQWVFHNNNLRALHERMSEQDRQVFCFDARGLNWSAYTESYCLGTKTYALKEDLANLPRARQALTRLQRINSGINFLLIIVLWRLLMNRVAMARNLWYFLVAWATKIVTKLPGFARS